MYNLTRLHYQKKGKKKEKMTTALNRAITEVLYKVKRNALFFLKLRHDIVISIYK